MQINTLCLWRQAPSLQGPEVSQYLTNPSTCYKMFPWLPWTLDSAYS